MQCSLSTIANLQPHYTYLSELVKYYFDLKWELGGDRYSIPKIKEMQANNIALRILKRVKLILLNIIFRS